MTGQQKTSYGPWSTKKYNRRSASVIAELKTQLYLLVDEIKPATVRQIFYQAVSRGLIEKTEKSYKNVVIRLLTDMRLEGRLPFEWITDNGRWMRKPNTYSSAQDALENIASFYRKSLWDNQDAYCEIWLEKDALSGVLFEVTEKWDVPLMVVRGYSSVTYLHEAAESIAYQGKPAYLYYFGDFDASGLDIPRNVESRLREFAPQTDIHFERVAVNENQIAEFNLPTRPNKKTDSRSKHFEGESSVEVDAIPPDILREMAEECILRHVNHDRLETMRAIEKAERQWLRKIANNIQEADV